MHQPSPQLTSITHLIQLGYQATNTMRESVFRHALGVVANLINSTFMLRSTLHMNEIVVFFPSVCAEPLLLLLVIIVSFRVCRFLDIASGLRYLAKVV